MLWAEKILSLFKHLEISVPLPRGVTILNPYQDAATFQLCEQFYKKYYGANGQRTLIIGINPGRFGGGLTGIPFTDPIKLEQVCRISNVLPKRAELSSDFIYQVIADWGGPETFYSRFYFSSVSPLGFIRDGKNLNYYDLPELQRVLMPFIKECLGKQMTFGLNPQTCFVLGEGKNYSFVNKLNEELKLFESVVSLPHPRFIMQYNRKQLHHHRLEYQRKLST